MRSLPNTCAITVTYGDRFVLCRNTIRRAFEAGVRHVVLVDNGSTEGTQLTEEFAEDPRVTLVSLERNMGSAGGFAAGLQLASRRPEEFMLLLDDDNLPEFDCLERAFSLRDGAVSATSNDNIVISCLRSSNPVHVAVARGLPVSQAYPPPGSFISFDVFQRLARFGRSVSIPPHIGAPFTQIPFGPYGGLLLSRSALINAGGPDPRLTLYEDDTAWTHHLSQNGYRILLCAEARIHDADAKWLDASSATRGPMRMLSSGNYVRLYYSVRNRVMFDSSRLAHWRERLRYHVNKAVFIVYVQIVGMRPSLRDARRTFRTAIKHGERGLLNLGPDV